ncbi:MAG: chromosome segregation protein SMC [Myxococcales bacterium]|nr:chromosome segregation protein SMC [Myxococcales bacterium]
MKLLKVELHGFKSFRAKTGFELGDGIAVIVGPNGCGKSNIVDAIRWTMGTQSAKALRGSDMSDVIFAGSRSRSPSGVAEVFLTFENTTPAQAGQLDIDEELAGSPIRSMLSNATTITVGRRLERSGDATYLINGSSVRLKDLQELFLGTGASVKGYSVIEQGQIDFLVNARPSERRRFVEELAGVTRYKFHRSETEKKLGTTQQNLDRLDDLLEEVRRRIAQLQRQARVAERHSELSTRRRRLGLAQLVQQRDASVVDLAEATAALEAERGVDNDLTSALRKEEHAEQRLSIEVSSTDRQVRELTEERFRLQAKRDLLGQASQHAVAEIEALRREQARILEDAEELREEGKQLETRLVQLDQERAEQADVPTGSEELEASVSEAAAVLSSIDRLLDRHDLEIRRAADELADYRATRRSQTAELERLERSAAEHLSKLESRRQAASDTQSQYEAAVQAKVLVEGSVTSSERKKGEADEAVEKARKAVEEAGAALEPLRAQAAALTATKKAKQESLAEVGEEGSRAVMKAAADGKLDGVLGLVGEGLIAPPDLDASIHGSLRQLASYVVVRDRDAAIEVIRFARKKKVLVGCVERRPENQPGPKTEGSLLDRIDAAEWIPSSVLDVLSAGRVVANLETAEAGAVGTVWVDTDGASFDHNGFWRSPDPSGGEITRQARLKTEIETAERRVKELAQQVAAAEDNQRRRRQALDDALSRRDDVDQLLAQSRRELKHASDKAASIQGAARAAKAQLEELESGNTNLARIKELQTALSSEDGKVALETKVNALQAKRDEERQRRDTQAAELRRREAALSERRAELKQIAERRRALDEERRRLAERVERNNGRIEKIARRGEEIERRVVQLTYESEANQRTAESVQVELDQKVARLSELEATVRAKRGELASLHDRARTLRTQSAELAARLERLSARKSQAERENERLQITLDQRYSISWDAAREEVGDASLPKDLDGSLARIQSEIDALGPINHAATAELEEAEQRFEFLCTQQGDLQRAIADMRATIDELDKASRDAFLTTFQDLRVEFERLFERLFRGGEATLALSDEGDPLNTGVEVFVRPPGKRVKSMSLLSGGEKAMTAVAFVFAAFRLKPSPFCILDEVDAPLDDANVERFVELIQELSRDTQFIVVSHNRRTMECAHSLVGVTMEEPGVSRLVGVEVPKRRDEPPRLVDEGESYPLF